MIVYARQVPDVSEKELAPLVSDLGLVLKTLRRGDEAGTVILEEDVHDRAAAQQRALLVGLPILIDVAFGFVEEKGDVVGRQALDSQKMPVGKGVGVDGASH